MPLFSEMMTATATAGACGPVQQVDRYFRGSLRVESDTR